MTPQAPLSSVPDRVLSPTRSASAEARRQRREQLRDFYGLPKGTASGGTSPASPTPTTPAEIAQGAQGAQGATLGPGSPLTPRTPRTPRTPVSPRPAARDLSSPAFVPAEYYEDLLARATLPELLATTADLAADVGRLQSSRHTLVYNHHHQLFSAGDTIAALNTRTPQLLSIVTSLQERFSDMSQLADSVALPEPEEAGDVGVARAGAGVERLRLMVLAEQSPENIREAWDKTEKALAHAPPTPALDALLKEGRALAAAAE